MKKFIQRITRFSIPLIVICVIGILLPVTPRSYKSLLFSTWQKDSLLKNTAPKRIIFVGASGLSFGLNSQIIKDSLNLNPINTGIHANLGLKYMLENTIQFVKKGDIVVFIPEYEHFYRAYDFYSEELFRTVLEVDRSKFKLLDFYQLVNFLPLIPKYSISKFNPNEYFNIVESEVYNVNSFNKYGDAVKHWGKGRQNFKASGAIKGEINQDVIQKVKDFRAEILKRGATLLVSYPGFQDIAYLKSVPQIKKVEEEYKKNGFNVLGNPERYMIPDSMMFNTSYHLNKKGVDYRTDLFLADFKKYELAH